jgi:uncharacterized protein (TIGR03067 family)
MGPFFAAVRGTAFRNQILIPVALVALLIGHESRLTGDNVQNKTSLEGKWHLIQAVYNGKPGAEDVIRETTVHFKGFGMSIIIPGEVIIKATFALDLSKTPYHFNFTPLNGPDKGIKLPGIYRLKAHKLVICYALKGNKNRPEAFSANSGSEQALVVLKKANN